MDSGINGSLVAAGRSDILYLLLGVGAVGMLLLLSVLISWWRTRWRIPSPPPWVQGAPSADAGTDAPSADQVFYDAAARFLEVQVGTDDVLDNKAAGILQVGSTVLPLTFGLLGISGRRPPAPTFLLLGFALAAYLVLLLFAWLASRIRAIEYRPDLATLQRNSQSFDGAILRRWVAEEYAASAVINRVALLRKARYVGVANAALFAEGMLASIAALATLL